MGIGRSKPFPYLLGCLERQSQGAKELLMWKPYRLCTAPSAILCLLLLSSILHPQIIHPAVFLTHKPIVVLAHINLIPFAFFSTSSITKFALNSGCPPEVSNPERELPRMSPWRERIGKRSWKETGRIPQRRTAPELRMWKKPSS